MPRRRSGRCGWSAITLREYGSVTKACEVVGLKLGIGKETLRAWARQARVDAGVQDGLSTAEREEIRTLKARVRRYLMPQRVPAKVMFSWPHDGTASQDCLGLSCAQIPLRVWLRVLRGRRTCGRQGPNGRSLSVTARATRHASARSACRFWVGELDFEPVGRAQAGRRRSLEPLKVSSATECLPSFLHDLHVGHDARYGLVQGAALRPL
jgi:hypothetical protein